MSTQRDKLATAMADAGIAFAYLFGSRAAGTQRQSSDADIAVMPTRDLGLLEQGRLADVLAGCLGVSEIDLVLLDRADLELRGHVVQEGKLIHSADEPFRVAFEVRTRAEYFDFLPTLRAHTRRYIEQVAEKGL